MLDRSCLEDRACVTTPRTHAPRRPARLHTRTRAHKFTKLRAAGSQSHRVRSTATSPIHKRHALWPCWRCLSALWRATFSRKDARVREMGAVSLHHAQVTRMSAAASTHLWRRPPRQSPAAAPWCQRGARPTARARRRQAAQPCCSPQRQSLSSRGRRRRRR